MSEIIKGNLIMEEDMTFKEDLKVEGHIFGKDGKRFNLRIYGDLNCRDLNCDDLNCDDLICWDLNCRDLNCRDLNCRDLNCGDLICWDLICWGLNCKGDISYYGVCCAYNNLRCKFIKGRRENSKHFVLDGEIIINGNKNKED